MTISALVRNFETHHRFARDDLHHAHADRRQRPREIFGERTDLTRLDAGRGTQLEARDHRTRQHGDDFDLNAEIFELELDEARHGLERFGRVTGLARRWIVEQLQRRQFTRLGGEQWHLSLFLDALTLLGLRRRWLDARLRTTRGFFGFDLERFFARGLALLALGDVALLQASRTHPVDGAPKSGAESVHHREP